MPVVREHSRCRDMQPGVPESGVMVRRRHRYRTPCRRRRSVGNSGRGGKGRLGAAGGAHARAAPDHHGGAHALGVDAATQRRVELVARGVSSRKVGRRGTEDERIADVTVVGEPGAEELAAGSVSDALNILPSETRRSCTVWPDASRSYRPRSRVIDHGSVALVNSTRSSPAEGQAMSA